MAKSVLITGCSSGIGFLAARFFAAHGWNVVATARDPATLTGIAGDHVLALPLDVTDERSIAAAVVAAVERFGSIDVLVNNAGYGIFGPLEAISADQLDHQFEVNVLGTAAMIRHVLPVMRTRHSGTIINMSSIGGRIGTPYVSAYYATKFAVEGLSESLRYELKAHGVRVKLIEPAHFKTGFIARALPLWATHADYEPQAGNMKAWVAHADAHAPAPDPVVAMIFKAATDTSDRLRYPVSGRLMLAVHALMPDALWRILLGAGMTRRPKAPKVTLAKPEVRSQPRF
jgi:NAD(P)-dependent dehydrogenase (short-subunit alcohol dehydrogenase family)